MPNGKIGDHPYTDIVVHGRELYSDLARSLILEIVSLGDDRIRHELADLLLREFNDFEDPDIPRLERWLAQLRDGLLREAKERGYEAH